MEDLRPNEEIVKDVLDTENTKLYYPSLKVKLVIWFDLYKKKLKRYSIIILVSFLFLKYPAEIGTFIGEWSYDFYSNIIKNFEK